MVRTSTASTLFFLLLVLASSLFVSLVFARDTIERDGRLQQAALEDEGLNEQEGFKETVIENAADTAHVSTERRVDDPPGSASQDLNDEGPELGGTSIIVDNTNSLQASDEPLDRRAMLEQQKAQAQDQARRLASEQALKKEIQEGKEAEGKAAEEDAKQATKSITSAEERKKRAQEFANKGVIRRRSWKLSKGEVVKKASRMSFSGELSYMFWIKPFQKVSGWSNVLHKGQADINRNPAIFMYPNDYRLHIRSGVNSAPNWGNGGNYGCDPTQRLAEKEWTHVAVTHKSQSFQVFYNGQLVCSEQALAPVSNTGDLYASNPWYNAAAAYLADLRFVARVVTKEEIDDAVAKKHGTK